MSKVNKVVTEEIAKFYLAKAKNEGATAPLPGAITFIQRTGSSLNANLHLHLLTIDGVFSTPATLGVPPRLHALTGPSDEDVATVVGRISKRTVRLLRRRG